MNKDSIITAGLLSIAGVIVAGIMVSYYNALQANDSDYNTPTISSLNRLPKCESTVAEDSMKSVVADGIWGKLGTKLLLVKDQKTISTSEKETKCEATIFLSQGGNYRTSYTFTDHGSKWIMQMAPVD